VIRAADIVKREVDGRHEAHGAEIQTVRKMIGIYCRGHHGGGKSLCEECRALSSMRTAGGEMPVRDENRLSQCPIHCTSPG